MTIKLKCLFKNETFTVSITNKNKMIVMQKSENGGQVAIWKTMLGRWNCYSLGERTSRLVLNLLFFTGGTILGFEVQTAL